MNVPSKQLRTRPVPSSLSADTENALRKTDSYRQTWQEYIDQFSPEQKASRQDRLIRKHAIETGILERLYDVSWGVTQSLVADGITADVYERASEVASEPPSQNALETIKVQLQALEMMVDFVRDSREFSVGFIKELHAAMTRNQEFVDSRDQFGRDAQMPLRHGEWKLQPNSVTRPDGTEWAFVDPMFVQDEIEFLVSEYHKKANVTHPIVLAAWIHYSFIAIHPFSDGNGRVARALTLFALLKGQYPPLVVTRDLRLEYIAALDMGNNGDIEPLIMFFAKLEENSLLGELNSEPVDAKSSTSVSDIAKAFAGRHAQQLQVATEDRKTKTAELAGQIQEKIARLLQSVGDQIQPEFAEKQIGFRFHVDKAVPPEPTSLYYQGQLITAARAVGFYSNKSDGTWWTCLTIYLGGKKMKFVAFVQKVGHGESGILAVTVSAEEYFYADESSTQEGSRFEDLLKLSVNDWVNMNYETKAEEVWPEIKDYLDRMVAAAITEFFNRAL